MRFARRRAEPARERRAVLVDRRGRDPAAFLFGIVGTAEEQFG